MSNKSLLGVSVGWCQAVGMVDFLIGVNDNNIIMMAVGVFVIALSLLMMIPLCGIEATDINIHRIDRHISWLNGHRKGYRDAIDHVLSLLRSEEFMNEVLKGKLE